MEIFDTQEKAQLPEENLFGEAIEVKTVLRDRFVEPPFTVLNANGGEWLKRKRAWGRLGIKSELGRDGFETYGHSITRLKKRLDGPQVKTVGHEWDMSHKKEMSNISIFDPVVCELMYKWFAREGGHILDPFSGGSVRGIVANYLGYNYAGVDLSAKQIEANRINADEIFEKNEKKPNWFIGDSESVLASSPNGGLFDLVFSCPPYADLEVYSQDPKDLSNMTYEQFVVKYRAIIAQAVRLLKRGGYAAFVVGEVRDKRRNGAYYNFVGDTVSAFIDAGADYYNEAILVTAFGTAMLRTQQFTKSRKMVKVHQNILVFRKP